jgi:hypothetical protein
MNQFGTILFTDDVTSLRGIKSVSADGGTPSAYGGRSIEGPLSHNWPQFLPDGRHFFFSVMSPRLKQARVGRGSSSGRSMALC